MAKNRKKAKDRIRPADHSGQPLSPEMEAAYWRMNDPDADIYDRLAAASLLAPIMHKPLPVRYLSATKAEPDQ